MCSIESFLTDLVAKKESSPHYWCLSDSARLSCKNNTKLTNLWWNGSYIKHSFITTYQLFLETAVQLLT